MTGPTVTSTTPVSTILVGIDFSEQSEIALRHALALARTHGARVLLLHAGFVPDLPTAPTEDEPKAMAHYRTLVEADLGANRERLEDLRTRHSGQGVELSHVVADGFPDAVIPRFAHEHGVRLIVLGSHGRTGLGWLVMGSVSRRVVRLAERDVLVARGPAPGGGYRHVCVATDFSTTAEHALDRAMSLAVKGAKVDLVHVWHLTPMVDLSGGLQYDLAGAREEVVAALDASGRKLVAAHARAGIDLSFRQVSSPTLPGLLETLEQGGHDLLVLGSHGRRGVRRFILGSVCESMVARAPCSTLVVHGTSG